MDWMFIWKDCKCPSLGRLFLDAWRNIKTYFIVSLPSVCIISLVLILFHVSLFLSHGVLFVSNKVIEKIPVIIEVQPNIIKDQLQFIIQDLDRTGKVRSVDFISKEYALEEFVKTHEYVEGILSRFHMGNPLPSTIEVSFYNIEDIPFIIKLLQNEKYSAFLQQSSLYSFFQENAGAQIVISFQQSLHYFQGVVQFFFALFSMFIITIISFVFLFSYKQKLKTDYMLGKNLLELLFVPFFELGLLLCFSFIITTFVSLLVHFVSLWSASFVWESQTVLMGISEVFHSFLGLYPQFLLFDSLLLFGGFCLSVVSFSVFFIKKYCV